MSLKVALVQDGRVSFNTEATRAEGDTWQAVAQRAFPHFELKPSVALFWGASRVEPQEAAAQEGDADTLTVVPHRAAPEKTAPRQVSPAELREAMGGLEGAGGAAAQGGGVSIEVAQEVHQRLRDFMGGLFDQSQEGEGEEQEPDADAAPQEDVRIDADALAQLTAIGYSQQASTRALAATGNSVELALEFLLQRPDDPALEREEVTQEELRQLRGPVRRRNREAPRRRREANPQMVEMLADMGFSAENASNALMRTGNDYNAAIELLLGGEVDEMSSSDEDDDMMEEAAAAYINNPRVAMLLANPVVQQGLSNPRVLMAFRALLESAEVTQRHLNDPEVGPVLLQVNAVLQEAEVEEGEQEEIED